MMQRVVPAVLAVAALAAGVTVASQQAVDVERLGPQVGQAVPALDLADPSGRRHTVASLAGPRGTMLVFFRSADW